MYTILHCYTLYNNVVIKLCTICRQFTGSRLGEICRDWTGSWWVAAVAGGNELGTGVGTCTSVVAICKSAGEQGTGVYVVKLALSELMKYVFVLSVAESLSSSHLFTHPLSQSAFLI